MVQHVLFLHKEAGQIFLFEASGSKKHGGRETVAAGSSKKQGKVAPTEASPEDSNITDVGMRCSKSSLSALWLFCSSFSLASLWSLVVVGV